MGLDKFNYKIFPEHKLIIRYYRGSFSVADFIHTMEETGKDSLYDSTYNVINDFREAESNVKIGEINKLFGYIKGHKMLYGKRKSAFLAKTPNRKVFSMMKVLLKHENSVRFGIFGTLEEAINWVDFPITDLDFIDKAIKDLKNGF